jgi:hypothetical protein
VYEGIRKLISDIDSGHMEFRNISSRLAWSRKVSTFGTRRSAQFIVLPSVFYWLARHVLCALWYYYYYCS